jgi:hypothetical protein
MGLKTRPRTNFVNIKEGKLYSQGNPFDTLEGRLVCIRLIDREFRGETVKYWYFDLEDIKTGEKYSLGIHYRSGVARSLINALASVQNYSSPVSITPYQPGEFTKVIVEQRGQKVPWKYEEFPPIQTVTLPGGETAKDDSDRLKFFRDLVDDINHRIVYTLPKPSAIV